MLDELLPLALSMASDPVPNLRLLLAAALQQAAPHLPASTINKLVLPTLLQLECDEDIDVLGAAKEAIEACTTLSMVE